MKNGSFTSDKLKKILYFHCHEITDGAKTVDPHSLNTFQSVQDSSIVCSVQ